MTEDEKRHRDYLLQSKARQSGPLKSGVTPPAGEKAYIEQAAEALDNPEAPGDPRDQG